MLFNSSEYMALFFPVVLLLCILLRRFAGARAAQALILVSSLFFYTWSKPSNLPYLIGSIVVNFALARGIASSAQPTRKRMLQLALTLNIGYLCLFKYVNFFLASFGSLLHGFHLPDLDFPLGISFFTLAQIMYLVDVYEQLLPPMNLFDYGTFVSFFPYIISGPIARAKRIRHQFGDFGGKGGAPTELIARGLFLFTMGLFKKVLLADAFAKLANPGFAPGAHLSALEALVASVAYTLQIYFDFSGYSDMAIGSALMLGIEIPRNFDAPLRSKSVIEFWTRWHISLSQFITTYLYTPIVKSLWRVSLFSSAVATFIAMSIAGLWHGPAWTFVIYGAIFGVALGINQYWRKKKMPILPGFVSWMVTFAVVDIALLFFRSPNVSTALHMLAAMVNLHSPFALSTLSTAASLTLVNKAMLIFGTGAAFFGKSSDELSREFKPSLSNALVTSAVFVASCLFMCFNTSQSFLYFQF
jgi:D-alanyl-lipoteichoic acid acyltransferase DltB (MBOAT superfamily)